VKPTIIGAAEKVINNHRLKKDMGKILDNYDENVRDIILIFVTDEWEVDAYWSNLPGKSVKKVLAALDRGIE